MAGIQIGVVAPQALPQASRIVGFDKELRMKQLLTCIFGTLSGVYNPENKTIPPAIYLKIDERVTSESLEAVVTMKLKLRGAAVYGNDFAISQEERPVTKSFKVYCNNLRKVISTPGYGRRQLEAAPYRLYETHIDDLADYGKEHEQLEIEQALVETFGETLVYGDTAADCIRNWNPNIFVCGLGSFYNASPAYNAVRALFTQNIVAKILQAGGGNLAPTALQVIDQVNASHLQNMAIAKRITPMPIPGLPGGEGWIVVVSELQAMYLGDPAYSTRNMGDLWKAMKMLDGEVMKWPGVIGSWKKLLFIENPRQPTLIPTGYSAGPFGLTPGYLWPGDVDDRERDNPDVIDTFWLLGKAAVVNWTPQKTSHIQQVDDYGAINGHGSQVVRGVTIPIYDGVGGIEQFGSIMGLARLPAYV